MKHLALLSALVLASSAVVADRIERSVDDPPPEPASCPLCGGDPQLHVVRVLAIEGAVAKALLRTVRW